MNLEIDNTSVNTIEKSFDRIAESIFYDFEIQVNEAYYRIIDVEFYYFDKNKYEDIFSHKHSAQLSNGIWYFHGSGMDITFGDGENYGGILIRGIAKISNEAERSKNYIEKQIHGPIKVVTEIFSNFKGVLADSCNIFKLSKVIDEKKSTIFVKPKLIIKTSRIGLNKKKETIKNFCDKKLRYVIFPNLQLKNKSEIARDIKLQFAHMSIEEINKELGSKILK